MGFCVTCIHWHKRYIHGGYSNKCMNNDSGYRESFTPPYHKCLAYVDKDIPVGCG